MTDREVRFYNFVYLFAINGVKNCDMRIMLFHYACDMSIKDIARLEKVSHQCVSNHIKKSIRIMRESECIEEFKI
jgi:predicted DNA-binding protein YlxM (UPF0122 family)